MFCKRLPLLRVFALIRLLRTAKSMPCPREIAQILAVSLKTIIRACERSRELSPEWQNWKSEAIDALDSAGKRI